MYVVTSFDFGGRSDVKLHVATENLDLAHEVYTDVLADCEVINTVRDTDATKLLVELTRIEKDTAYTGPDAPTLFWGAAAVANNNNNKTP